MTMSSIFKSFNLGYISTPALNLAGSLGFVADAIGRIGFGAMIDAVGFKKT